MGKTKQIKETLEKFEKRMEKIIHEILEEEKKKNEKYGDQLKLNIQISKELCKIRSKGLKISKLEIVR